MEKINMIEVTRVAKIGLKVLIVIIILWLVGTFTKDWIKPRLVNALGGYTAKDVKTTIDTLETKVDTVYLKQIVTTLKVDTIYKPRIIYKYPVNQSSISNTQTKGNQAKTVQIDSVFAYNQPVLDSLINGNIRTIIDLQNCKIVEQSITYKPKFPYIVTKYITIEKNNETTLYNKPKAKFGVGITGTSNSGVGVVGVYQTPKNWQYQGGYIKDINNVLIGEQKGFVSLSIIKLF